MSLPLATTFQLLANSGFHRVDSGLRRRDVEGSRRVISITAAPKLPSFPRH